MQSESIKESESNQKAKSTFLYSEMQEDNSNTL